MAEGKHRVEGLLTSYIKFSDIGRAFYLVGHPDETAKNMVILFDEAE